MLSADVRVRWAAIGAAVAVTLGAGGLVGVSASGSDTESTLVPVTPTRVLDTRTADRVGDLTDGDSITVQVTGTIATVGAGTQQLVPEGAEAIIGNLTMVDTQANEYGGFATIHPCGDRPNASSVNFVSGQTVANSVAVPLSVTGTVCIYVYGTAHVLLDVSGYYTSERLSQMAADPLGRVVCPETAMLMRQNDDWVCAPTPGVEVVEDANGREFTVVNGSVEIDGVQYRFFSGEGFVNFDVSPGDWSAVVYHESSDCSGPGYVRTDADLAALDPENVFDGFTYPSGAWGDEVSSRLGSEPGETAVRYWRLEESRSIADTDVGSEYSDGDCDPLTLTAGDWNGAVAYELVWGDVSVTEEFTPPFSKVFGDSGGGLCVAEAGVAGEVTASSEVIEAAC